MYVVYGYGELYLPYCSSLKEKRKIIHGLISRIRKRFNVSICEVQFHDLWQRSWASQQLAIIALNWN